MKTKAWRFSQIEKGDWVNIMDSGKPSPFRRVTENDKLFKVVDVWLPSMGCNWEVKYKAVVSVRRNGKIIYRKKVA